MFVWADAAAQNRRDGSTQGIFVGLAPLTLLDGWIAWHAGKIDRIARSPGAAETIAVVNGEDCVYHARYQLGEILQATPNVFDVDATVSQVEGCVISDSRNVYDKHMTEELRVKGTNKRSDLELLCLVGTA